MKRILIATSFAMLLTGSLAHAQRVVMNARIPFDFQASGVKLPAGTYEVTTGIAPGIVRLSSFEHKTGAMLVAQPVQAPAAGEQCRLLFHRYGDRYFLSQLWEAGNNTGLQLKKTKAEIEAAAAKPGGEHVMVAAQR